MDYTPLASLIIFLVTLFLMVKRPKRINLGIAAGIGAIASLLVGTVTIADAVSALLNIWDAALAFVGIVTLSVTLDTMGFFRWAALRVAKIAHGSGLRLYFLIALLTAAVSILFANDSAVLILTPIVMEMVRQLRMTKQSSLAYLFGAGLIADTAAMPLITSNPVNIVSADYFGYTFVQHMIFMVPIAIVTILISLFTVYMFFRKKIPKTYPTEIVDVLVKHDQRPMWFRTSIVTLVAIDVGYIIASFNGIPVSFVICSGAFFLLGLYAATYRRKAVFREERIGTLHVMRKVNWDILFFMIGIFLVVQGLRHAGAVDLFQTLFTSALTLPSFLPVTAISFIVTMGASAINNWPMTFLGLLSVKSTIVSSSLNPQTSTILIFGNIIGNNLGPHFFPLGSLAILMWLGTMKRKGLTVSFKDYLKVGTVLSILEVTAASIMLWIEVTFLHLSLTIAL
jgi:arsenical pump membrane protein